MINLLNNNVPRVALFADTYQEVNGAANVIRRLQGFAEKRNYPFLCVYGGDITEFRKENNSFYLQLKRAVWSFPIDGKLKCDPLIWRYSNYVRQIIQDFKPDVVHLTGLNDISQIGFYLAHQLKIKRVASWHTNTHEYAARRLLSLTPWLSPKIQVKLGESVETNVLRGLMKLYSIAHLQLAPNQELVKMMQEMTQKPSSLMSRGVDLEMFSPEHRFRSDDSFVIGYVGRLRPEKNVRFLAEISKALEKANVKNYKFVIAGEGSDEDWLRQNLPNVELKGVLKGEDLAKAYANMDLFVFPSLTDAFGNVVLEAMASGVPAVVMPEGGPKFLIEHNSNGYIAGDSADFVEAVVNFVKNPSQTARMSNYARLSAAKRSWESVFEEVYRNYSSIILQGNRAKV